MSSTLTHKSKLASVINITAPKSLISYQVHFFCKGQRHLSILWNKKYFTIQILQQLEQMRIVHQAEIDDRDMRGTQKKVTIGTKISEIHTKIGKVPPDTLPKIGEVSSVPPGTFPTTISHLLFYYASLLLGSIPTLHQDPFLLVQFGSRYESFIYVDGFFYC